MNTETLLKTNIPESLCCGCGACVQICPKKAMTMQPDAEGFLRPVLNEDLCISCGICAKTCPMNDESRAALKYNTSKESYACIHKEKTVAAESSSGGAFTAIAEAFCDGEYLVFGAQWGDDFYVYHSSASDVKNLSKFRKSKYIPSDTKQTFAEAKQALKEGKKVLFTGTPCQIAGLKLFVGEKLSENLLTIDFSCHGVGNPSIFKRYVKEIGEAKNKKVTGYEFRFKARSLSAYSCVSSRFTFEDKTHLVRYKDPWFRGFVSALFKRESCYSCPFAKIARISDLTIADYWGIERISKNFNSGKGVSLLLANTPKGESVLSKLPNNMTLEAFSLESCLTYNIPLNHKVERTPKTAIFRKNLENNSVEESILNALGRPTKLQIIVETFLRLFPIRLAHKITRTTKRFTGFVKTCIIKVLPAKMREKILNKWAEANGRKR